MTRGKVLLASLAIAGGLVLGVGASSTPASAQAYAACAPGYYYSAGYCYPDPNPPPVAYYPPGYYAPPPVVLAPTIGFGFGFGGGGWHGDGGHGGWHH